MQIIDSKFESMEMHGKALITAGVLKHSDIDAGMKGIKPEGQIMLVGVAAYAQVKGLNCAVKSNSTGILLGTFVIASTFSIAISSFVLFVNRRYSEGFRPKNHRSSMSNNHGTSSVQFSPCCKSALFFHYVLIVRHR
jgi:hypothetical protein